ncbi:hypothetical protein VPH35_035566 [Triticum aestivum]|uniref:Uncharacterized protein n=1 Tax=Aegilops tauschii TaxID=37682 RepID=R7VZH6_AEGTA
MAAALSPPPLPEGEANDATNWVLLDTQGYIARCPNATFAESFTGIGYRVEVSFCTARPPHVSHFCVHIPGVEPSNYLMAPRVISAEANLILFCLSVYPRYRDYFIYRAHPRNPSLELLPHPYPNSFGDQEVALLSFVVDDEDDDDYAVAALTSRGNWRGYRQFRPYLIRDITVSLLKGSIKYVEIEVCPRAAPDHPPESYVDWFGQKRREEQHQCGTSCAGWKATTWSLSTSVLPSADWNSECTFHLADIAADPMHSELLPRPPHDTSDSPAEPTLLQQLIVGFPTLSMDDDVVYVLSKGCPKGLMEVVIAVDMRKKKVRGVAKLVSGKDFTFMRNCTSELSKYL